MTFTQKEKQLILKCINSYKEYTTDLDDLWWKVYEQLEVEE